MGFSKEWFEGSQLRITCYICIVKSKKMKFTCSILIASVFSLLSTINYAQTSLFFSNPVQVSTGDQYGSIRPRIALKGNDVPVVVWGKGNPKNIFISSLNGSSFTTPVQVNPSGVSAYAGLNDGPNIAAEGSVVFVVYSSSLNNDGVAYCMKSIDGGQTFQDTVRVDQLQTQAETAYSPHVVIDETGNPVVAFEKGGVSPFEQMVGRSTDGGLSFGTSVSGSTLSPGEACECCPPMLCVKDSTVVLLYRNNDNDIRDIYASTSFDWGQSFNQNFNIDTSNWYFPACPTQGPYGILNNDSLAAVWVSGGSGESRALYCTFNYVTQTLGAEHFIDTVVPANTQQRSVVIEGNGDTLAVAWYDNRTGDKDCYLKYTVSGMANMSSTYVINTATEGHQVNPHLAFAKGVFHITWQDQQTGTVWYRSAQIVPVGVEEVTQTAAVLKVFPNPATPGAAIFLAPEVKISEGEALLKDLSGQILYKTHLQPGWFQLPVDLKSGYYLLQIKSGQTRMACPLVVISE